MICAVNSPQRQQQFLKALEASDCTATHSDLGAHFAAFAELPGSGWQFYTGAEQHLPFALAVQGSRAILAGEADGEELDSFLTFLGVKRLKTSGQIPNGWNVTQQPQRFILPKDKTAISGKIPQQIQLDRLPSLQQVTELLAQGTTFAGEPQEVLDCFYSEACTLRNRGLAQIWAVRNPQGLVATAGAYGIWNKTAYLAAVETHLRYRGKGYGRAMVAALSNDLVEQGCLVELLCKPGSEDFYHALGFLQQGQGCYCAQNFDA